MTQELCALLDQYLLPQETKEVVAKLGCTEINDISWLKERDLEWHQLNIRVVPWRKLLQAVGGLSGGGDGYWPGGRALPPPVMTMTMNGGSPAGSRQEELDLEMAAQIAHETAIDRLSHAQFQYAPYRDQTDWAEVVMNGLRYAMGTLGTPDCTNSMAANAVRALLRSKAKCPTPLRGPVNEALISARDNLVLKIQMQSPLTNREEFIRKLHAALIDSQNPEGQLNKDEVSQFVKAHSHAVGKLFPQAFITNNERAAAKRGPRRKRGRWTTPPAKQSEPANTTAFEWADSTANSPESGPPSHMKSVMSWLGPPPGLELQGPPPQKFQPR